jgi:hypothetical protein
LLRDTDVSLAGDVDVHRAVEPAAGNVMRESGNSVRSVALSGEKEISGADGILGSGAV